jgi:hypothetical protein
MSAERARLRAHRREHRIDDESEGMFCRELRVIAELVKVLG